MHMVGDRDIVWHGGSGHKLISLDADPGQPTGVSCYRCGMAAEPDAWQELIPDCTGPEVGGDHHYVGELRRGLAVNACHYGDATISDRTSFAAADNRCVRG
jgi:hypothetical protein